MVRHSGSFVRCRLSRAQRWIVGALRGPMGVTRVGAVTLAVLVAVSLVADALAAPFGPAALDGGIRQVSSYELAYNPFGDPWATKAAPNQWIPVGLTPACHRQGPKVDVLTPNADEVAFLAKSNNQIIWEECGDPMEPPPPGSPPSDGRRGDPVLKNWIAAVKAANPTVKYIGYVNITTHSTQSLRAPVTPAGLLDFEPIESYFIHRDGTTVPTKQDRVKYVDGIADIYNVTNAEWRQAMANKLKASLDYHQLDGIVVDFCFDIPVVNGPGPSAATLAAWQGSCVQLLATLKATMPDKLILPTGYTHRQTANQPETVNGLKAFEFYTQRVDVSDGFYWEDPLALLLTAQPNNVYLGTINRFREVQNYAAQRGKYLANIVNTNAQGQSTFEPPEQGRGRQLQLARFYLAAHLTQFVDHKTLMHLYTPVQLGNSFFSDAFFKDWDQNIGAPTGGATQPAGADVAIYQRDFQRARVVMNASPGPYTVNLSSGGPFTTLDGQAVTSFQMPPKTGMIFLIVQEQLTCTPRPPVRTAVQQLGGGRLQVDITLTQGGGWLRSIQIDQPLNATVDVQNGPSGVTSPLLYQPTSTTSTSARLFVQRRAAGPFTVQLRVTDGCGEWRTLAGGGANVP